MTIFWTPFVGTPVHIYVQKRYDHFTIVYLYTQKSTHEPFQLSFFIFQQARYFQFFIFETDTTGTKLDVSTRDKENRLETRIQDKKARTRITKIIRQSFDEQNYIYFHLLGDKFGAAVKRNRDLFILINSAKRNAKPSSWLKKISFSLITPQGVTTILVINLFIIKNQIFFQFGIFLLRFPQHEKEGFLIIKMIFRSICCSFLNWKYVLAWKHVN